MRFGAHVWITITAESSTCLSGELAWPEINFAYAYVERDEDDQEHELVMSVIELPEHRTKNGRPHLIPLCPDALTLLPERSETCDYVFGLRGAGFTSWAKSNADLVARITKARKGKPMQRRTLYDLRHHRYYASLAAACRLPPWRADYQSCHPHAQRC